MQSNSTYFPSHHDKKFQILMSPLDSLPDSVLASMRLIRKISNSRNSISNKNTEIIIIITTTTIIIITTTIIIITFYQSNWIPRWSVRYYCYCVEPGRSGWWYDTRLLEDKYLTSHKQNWIMTIPYQPFRRLRPCFYQFGHWVHKNSGVQGDGNDVKLSHLVSPFYQVLNCLSGYCDLRLSTMVL